jgi:hypothetical protein
MEPFQERIDSIQSIINEHADGADVLNRLEWIRKGYAVAKFIHALNQRRRDGRAAGWATSRPLAGTNNRTRGGIRVAGISGAICSFHLVDDMVKCLLPHPEWAHWSTMSAKAQLLLRYDIVFTTLQHKHHNITMPAVCLQLRSLVVVAQNYFPNGTEIVLVSVSSVWRRCRASHLTHTHSGKGFLHCDLLQHGKFASVPACLVNFVQRQADIYSNSNFQLQTTGVKNPIGVCIKSSKPRMQ